MANSTDQGLFRYVHHTFRDGASGVSLHPLQRDGVVSADGNRAWGSNRRTFGPRSASIFDAPPAAEVYDIFPQTVPLIGSPRDPRFMVS